MTNGTKRMVSIWTWSALILGVYGVLLLGAALVRLGMGEIPATKMAHLRADLWWPLIMLAMSGGLFWAGRVEQRGDGS
ncbi:MAG: hypothetical protein ABIK09_05695 [Pseudomonadota bacterium]